MSQPHTLNTIEKRWQRRLICFGILPVLIPITVAMMIAAAWGRAVGSARFLVEYWRR